MDTIRALERTLGRVLEKGISIPDDTLFFAESTYGITDESLVSALLDSEFEGKEALAELIFTPDPTVRTAVEPLLPVNGMKEADIEDLAAALAAAFTTVDLLVSGHTAGYPVNFDLNTVRFFLQKLYLDRAIDGDVAAALERTFSSAAAIDARIIMRCRGDVFSESKRPFMCRFIARSRSFEKRFTELLAITLTVLAETGDEPQDEQQIEACFLRKRRALVKALKELRIFTAQQAHYSMEYLMMQRFRVPHESEEEIRNRLFLLTTVTDTILGLPPDPAAHVEARNLGSADEDIEHLIRTLS